MNHCLISKLSFFLELWPRVNISAKMSALADGVKQKALTNTAKYCC